MKVAYDEVLQPLCSPEHTYEQLLEAIAQAGSEAGPGGYVFVHGSENCTEETCVCDGPVVIGPLPEAA